MSVMVGVIDEKLETWIQNARAATRAREVTLHKLPRWASAAITAAYKRDGVPRPSFGFGSEWSDLFDHWGTSQIKRRGYDGKSLVTEPYGYRDHIELALKFADWIGCEVEIGRASWWYPGSTIRIEFYPKVQGESA